MANKIDEVIYYLADAITKAREFEAMMALPNCNTCYVKRECKYTPKPGDRVRINCALWEGEDGEE